MASQTDADLGASRLGGRPLRSYGRASLRNTSQTSNETASAVAFALVVEGPRCSVVDGSLGRYLASGGEEGVSVRVHGPQDVPLNSTSLVATVPAVRPGAVW